MNSANRKLETFGLVAVFALLSAGTSLAGNVYFKAGGNGHWSDGSNWQGGRVPGAGDTARLYTETGVGGSLAVDTEEDWASYNQAPEVVLNYGAKLTLATDVDRSSSVALWGNTGVGCRVFKKGTGKLTLTSQYFQGLTVVESGQMTMGATSAANAGAYEVKAGAVLETYPSGMTYMLGLKGDGIVTNGTGKQLRLVASNYAGKDPDVLPPYRFGGKLTGKIDLTAGSGDNLHLSATGQYFDGMDSSDVVLETRMYNGIIGVASVGTTTKSAASSIGNGGALNYFTYYSDVGDEIGFLHLGEEYATDRPLSLDYSTNPGRKFVFDAGANGGITFTGRWTCYSQLGEGSATCFVLDGSNTAQACTIDGEIVERWSDASSQPSQSALAFVKRGTGIWKFGGTYPHENKGPILVERGRLEYATLAEAGQNCSLGLMTQWTTNFLGVSDCPSVGFAYLLGNGDNEVVEETATLAYTGLSAASCSTRPLALKGAGRFANDSECSMSYAGATAAEEGKDATLVLAGKNGGTFSDVTNGVGRLSVVKEGTGTWKVTENVELASVKAKQGTLTIGANVNYEFYRWTIKAVNLGDPGASSWLAAFNGFALMDDDGNILNGSLGKSGVSRDKAGHPEQLGAGEICYSDNIFAGTSNVNRPIDRAFDWNQDTQAFREPDASIEITLENDDPSTHPVIYFRTDPGVRVSKYDVLASGSTARDVVCWELAGSVDGRNWDVLHTRETCSAAGYTALSANQWHSTGNTTRGGWEIASSKAGAKPVVGSVCAAAGATVEFTGNAEGTRVSSLVLSANGGGTINGIAFAETGTIEITDFDRSKLDGEISLNLFGCEDVANVGDWNLIINGKKAKYRFGVTATGVTVYKNGFGVMIR